jgi:hypothetical protein
MVSGAREPWQHAQAHDLAPAAVTAEPNTPLAGA